MKNPGISLDSDSDSGDDQDFFIPNNEAAGAHIVGTKDGDDGILADCEFLRARNADLKAEIDRINNLIEVRNASLPETQRKLELVWGTLPPKPWSLSYYLTFRGFEYVQLYLWIIRDLGWTWGWYWRDAASIVGGFAVLHACLLSLRNTLCKDPFESFFSYCKLLWIASMYRFEMATLNTEQAGRNYRLEPHYISNRIDKGSLSQDEIDQLAFIKRQTIACLAVAFALMLVHVILKYRANKGIAPFKDNHYTIFGLTFSLTESPYLDSNIFSVLIKYVCTWRDLELLVFIFLVGRDLAFLCNSHLFWSVCFSIALLLPLFTAHITMNLRGYLVEHCHYLAIAVWVGGMGVWEMGHGVLKTNWSAWDFVGP